MFFQVHQHKKTVFFRLMTSWFDDHHEHVESVCISVISCTATNIGEGSTTGLLTAAKIIAFEHSTPCSTSHLVFMPCTSIILFCPPRFGGFWWKKWRWIKLMCGRSVCSNVVCTKYTIRWGAYSTPKLFPSMRTDFTKNRFLLIFLIDILPAKVPRQMWTKVVGPC